MTNVCQFLSSGCQLAKTEMPASVQTKRVMLLNGEFDKDLQAGLQKRRSRREA